MSDISGTVIKLLSSFVSPKSSFKIILIAASITLFWLYFQPELLAFNLPAELTSLVTLLVGVGIGSLVCDLIFFSCTATYKAYQGIHLKKLSAIQEAREKAKILDLELVFVDQFKEAYKHYNRPMKQVLRELVTGNKPYSDTSIVMSLHRNKTILKVSRIDSDKWLYTINPLLLPHVKEQWEAEIETGINDFLIDMSPLKVRCLNILELSESSFDGKTKKLEKSLFTDRYQLQPVILNNFVDPEESFYLYFNEGYLKALETRLSREFVDEIEVILE